MEEVLEEVVVSNELLDMAIPLLLEGKCLDDIAISLSLDRRSLFILFKDRLDVYLKARVDQGYTMGQLVEDSGVNRTTLLHHLQKYDLKLARKPRTGKYITEEDRKKAIIEGVSNWRRDLKKSKALVQFYVPFAFKEEVDAIIGGETLERFFIKVFNYYKENSKNG